MILAILKFGSSSLQKTVHHVPNVWLALVAKTTGEELLYTPKLSTKHYRSCVGMYIPKNSKLNIAVELA